MDEQAIEALLDEFDIMFGRLTCFNNGNCLINPLTQKTPDEIRRALETTGFSGIEFSEDQSHVWFTVNGRTVHENMADGH